MSTKTTKKTSTAATEIVYGQAAKDINKAVAALVLVTSQIQAIEEEGEKLTLVIANKNEELENLVAGKKQELEDLVASKEKATKELDVTYTEKERQLTVDLDLRMKATTETVVTEYLKGKGSVAINATELQTLKTELETVKTGLDTTVKAEVGKAVGIAKSQHDSDVKLMNAEYRAKEAENLSKINVLTDKVSFLESTIEKMYEQIDQERSASVQRSQAAAVGTISIGNSDRK